MTYTTLILGAGKHHQRQPGHVTLDVRPFAGIDIIHDLNVTPWPIETATFDEASAIHVVEHLQSLLAFMDECWRVLKPGGALYLETPLAGGDIDLQFADPTHVRCYRPHSFINYFTRQGIEAFGYTERAWSVLYLGQPQGQPNVLAFHGQPIK